MTMATADYGYGDAAPDSTLPDTTDYGYGDAVPSTTDYGYGDAAPSVETEKDYGYGDAAPDTDKPKPADDASKYGYGDDTPAAPETDYGYGEYTSGYNDNSNNPKPKRIQRNKSVNELEHSTHSTSASVESYGSYGQPRRQRYRRRGSVTKYSIESTTEVQQENQDLCQPHREYTMPADNSYNPDTYNAQYNNGNNGANNIQSTELSGEDQFDAHSGDGEDPKKKGGKKVKNMMKGLRQMSKRRFSTY
jgi:hypothetical protein